MWGQITTREKSPNSRSTVILSAYRKTRPTTPSRLIYWKVTTSVMYSDGISETVAPAGEMFGYERTIETVREACAKGIGAEDLVDRLMSRARECAGEEPQADDMTCVVVRVER